MIIGSLVMIFRLSPLRLARGAVLLENKQSGGSRPLRDGEVLTYGKIRVEVRASGGKSAKPAPAEEVPSTARERDRAAADVPDRVKQARAREGKWYDAEVSPTVTRRTTRDR